MPTARELGIGFLAYSPLGRGMLTGQLKALRDVPDSDWRKAHNPRFQGENFAKAGVDLALLQPHPRLQLLRTCLRMQHDCFLDACCALPQNLQLAENVEALAAKKGCTPGQLALAWVRKEDGVLTRRRLPTLHAASWRMLGPAHQLHLCRCWRGARTSSPSPAPSARAQQMRIWRHSRCSSTPQS